MKYLLALFLLFCKLDAFPQNASVKLNIIITDTSKPYFLEINFNIGTYLIKKITVTESGTYPIRGLSEGDYNIEFYAPGKETRSLNLSNIHFSKDSVNQLSITYPGPCKFIYLENYKPTCPYNHSDNIVPIIYGYPTSKTMKKAKKGLIHLGGCILSNCDPKFYCNIHKIEL